MSQAVSRDMAKYWWLRCVGCAEASVTTQMRGLQLEEPAYEQALHSLSGGFMHLGHVCGLLTGAVVAAGFVARARFDDDDTRAGATLYAAIQLARAYPELSGSVNCREITEVPLTTLVQRLRYLQAGKARLCGHLHLKWAPQAHELIDRALTEFGARRLPREHTNCAVRTLEKLVSSTGMNQEDSVLLAGLAGGVGLLGNVCGALAAGVYAMSVSHYLEQPGKRRDSRMRGSLEELAGTRYRGAATRLRTEFVDRYGSELCVQIAQRGFQVAEGHSAFIQQGGCHEVIEFVTHWVEDRYQSLSKDRTMTRSA